MASDWDKEAADYRANGFTEDEIAQEGGRLRKEMSDQGFSGKEVDGYFGVKEPDMAPMKQYFEANLAKHQETKAAAPHDPAKQADGFLESLEAGWQMSVSGLIARGQAPDTVLPENAPMMARIASQSATLAGDVPAMLAGAFAGGAAGTAVAGPVGAVLGTGGGTFALPTAIRSTLMQHYEKGDIKDFGDFWERSSSVFLDTMKSAAVGVATAGAGGVAGKLVGPLATSLARGSAVATSELATMVTVGKAMEGEVPKAQDFVDAAILIGGMHATGMVSTKLRTIYAKTGMRPEELLDATQKDPTVQQDILSSNVEVPKALESMVDGGTQKAQPAELHPSLTEKSQVLGDFGPELQVHVKVDEPLPAEKPITEVERSEAEKAVLSRLGKPKSEPFTMDKLVEKAHQAYTDVVDVLHPLDAMTKNLSDGKDLQAIDNPYLLLRNTRGDFGRLQSFIEHGPVKFGSYEVVGKPLTEIVEPIKADPAGFEAYAMSARAIELAGRGIETGIPLEDAKTVETAGRAKYGQVMKDLVEFQNHALAYLRDSGLKSGDAYDAMVESNKNFVPLKRVMDEGGGGGSGRGQGFTVRDPVKGIKGSDREILSPIETAVENVSLYLSMSERNRAMTKMAELAESSPEGEKYMKRVATPQKAIEVRGSEVAKLLREHGVDADPEALTIFRPKSTPLRDNEIALFREGKREVYEVAPELASAIKNFDAESMGLLSKILNGFTKSLKAGSVLSPDFMARNMSRDLMTAFNLSGGFFNPTNVLSGLGSLLKKDDHFYNWLRGGGGNSSFFAIDKAYLDENVFKLSKETGLIDKTWNVLKSPIEILRATGELIENSTRLGEFKRASAGKQDINTIMDSAFKSREVTLDFARMGAKTRSINAIVAFFNAQIQGLDKTARAFKERPYETSAKVAASITLPSVALWWANHDDPRYQEIPRWQKDLFWIVMTKDHIFRIPKPAELGIIFGSGAERALEAYFGDNPNAYKDFEKTMMGAFAPSYLPTAVVPVMEHAFNKSTFTGSQVVPANLEKVLPEYQYTEYTTEAGKMLGKMVAAVPGMRTSSFSSPMVIENYVRGWSGSLGAYALQLADRALIKAGAVPDPVRPASTLADIPVIKAFTIRFPSSSAQSIQDFYEKHDENKRVLDTIRHLAKSGDFENMQKELLLSANQDKFIALDGMKEALSNQSKFIRMVYKNPDLKPDEKRQLIDGVYYGMINTAKQGNKMLSEISKAFSK